jgi:hypothetical protein
MLNLFVTFLFGAKKKSNQKKKGAEIETQFAAAEFPSPRPVDSRGAMCTTGIKTHTIVSNAQTRRFRSLNHNLFKFLENIFWKRMNRCYIMSI